MLRQHIVDVTLYGADGAGFIGNNTFYLPYEIRINLDHQETGARAHIRHVEHKLFQIFLVGYDTSVCFRSRSVIFRRCGGISIGGFLFQGRK